MGLFRRFSNSLFMRMAQPEEESSPQNHHRFFSAMKA
jgi:hypothetical protein